MNYCTTIKSFLLFYGLICFFYSTGWSQDRYQIGIIPQMNNEFALGDQYELNSKVEARQLLKNGPDKLVPDKGFHFERTDIETILNRKLSPLDGIGIGYLFRVQEGKIIHRFIQQYATVRNFTGFRLAHRFRIDETFDQGDFTFRARYRLSLEKPLNGLVIDPKEFYLKFNNEYLPTFERSNVDIEIRVLASLGYNLSEQMKFETGLDYRAEDIIASDTEHQCWLNIGWYHSF